MHAEEELSDEDYAARIDKVTNEAAEELRLARGQHGRTKQACCRYLKRGSLAGLSHPELVDFLGVSSPSILDLAGFSDEEALAVMDSLTEISDAEIEKVAI